MTSTRTHFAIALCALLLGACSTEPTAAPDPAGLDGPPASSPTEAQPVAMATEAPTGAGETGGPADDTGTTGPDAAGGLPQPAGGAPKLSLTETYTSDLWGYALDYPTGWLIDDTGGSVILRSAASEGPGSDGVPAHMTKIDIVTLEGFALDLDARVAQVREELDALTEEQRFTLQTGQDAVWLRGSGAMTEDTGIVLTIVGNQLYQLQAFGDPRPLPAIAFTFRPASGD
ncbi:MAG: hypothetical protein H6648_05260 [Caldilineae bacterium]|nr:hypothetical protein [Chloroflexota bacterium]MCB9176551.1 hypothetical protein [Caldilineae bacterium]